MVQVEIEGQLVVSAAQVLDERMSSADHSCGAQPFETTHGSKPGLQPAVIGFDRIVCILLGDVAGGGQQLIEYAWICCSPVGGHLGR